MKPTRNLICIGLALALIFPVETLPAQVRDQDQTPPPTALNLVIVEGEGAINNIRQRVARDPIVRVEDENHKPIAGAVVVFTLPTEGATGEFGGGSKSVTVNTDTQGLAKAQGLKLGGLGGKLPIHITASYRGQSARITLTQFVEVPAGMKPGNPSSSGGHGKLIAILAVVGGAAAGGAVYAVTRNSSSSTVVTPPPSGPTPIGIAAGAGTISPPR